MNLKEKLLNLIVPTWIVVVVSFLSWIYLKVFYDQIGAIYTFSFHGAILDFFTFTVRNFSVERGYDQIVSIRPIINYIAGTLSGFFATGVYTIYKKKENIEVNSKVLANGILWVLLFVFLFTILVFVITQDFLFYFYTGAVFILVTYVTLSAEKIAVTMKKSRLYTLVCSLFSVILLVGICKGYQIVAIEDSKMFMDRGFKFGKVICIPEKMICGHFVNDNEEYLCLKQFNIKRTKCFKKDPINELVFKSDVHN